MRLFINKYGPITDKYYDLPYDFSEGPKNDPSGESDLPNAAMLFLVNGPQIENFYTQKDVTLEVDNNTTIQRTQNPDYLVMHMSSRGEVFNAYGNDAQDYIDLYFSEWKDEDLALLLENLEIDPMVGIFKAFENIRLYS